MIIYMNEYGKKLGMTKTAEKIRNEIELNLFEHDQITIDFTDVESMCTSFVCELLLKLYSNLGKEKFKQSIKLENLNTFNKIVVRNVLSV